MLQRYCSHVFDVPLQASTRAGPRWTQARGETACGRSTSFEEATPSAAADSSEATGGSPSGEVPAGQVRQKAMPKKRAKAKASTDADSAPTGGSPSGEVPVVDEASLRTSEGNSRYSYEAGDTVHGRVDATRLQQEEELQDIIQKARYNPWHFFHHGLLHRKDSSGNTMYAPYGDAFEWLWRPFLSQSLRTGKDARQYARGAQPQGEGLVSGPTIPLR